MATIAGNGVERGMGPSIVQRNDIDPVQKEVKDAGIKTGNDNEDVAPKHGGHPVPNAPDK